LLAQTGIRAANPTRKRIYPISVGIQYFNGGGCALAIPGTDLQEPRAV